MRKISFWYLIFVFCFTSCVFNFNDEECIEYYEGQVYREYKYDYKDWKSLKITFEAPRVFKNFGKIYVYENKLFVNDIQEGIHILDISEKSNPINLGFLKIPGNVDLSITCNTLFADSFSDLLSIDISDLNNVEIINREHFVFANNSFYIDYDSLYIRRYEAIDTVYSYDCSLGNIDCFDCDFDISVDSEASPSGTGGSLARFSFHNNNLYTVDQSTLNTFVVENCRELKRSKPIDLGWGIETIYGFNEYLFIGSNTGMQIYTGTSTPEYVSELRHEYSCDPVFPTENRAYVTLRGGNSCWNGNDELDVVDIEDITNPKLIKAYDVASPYGLSIDGEIMYLCQGSNGFSIYDISDDLAITDNKLAAIMGINAFDVISLGNEIIVTGLDNVYFYDVMDKTKPRLLSKIRK